MNKSEEKLYEVECIVAEKVISYPERPLEGSIFRTYKVRWKGYGKEHDTWEPEGHLVGCEQLLQEWRARNPIPERIRGSSGKRKTDAMEIDSGSGGGSSPERPSKTSRTRPKFEPGTSAYARYRKNLATEEDPNTMHPDRKRFIEKLQNIPGPPIVLYNDQDDDPCPPVSFEFIPRYKIIPPVVDFIKENDEFWAGCSCEGGICKSDCSCMEDNVHHGRHYNKHGRLLVNDNGSAISECNERCSCGIDCPNRVVQRGRKIPLEIFKTEKKGWGLRCPQRIPKGTFIDTYPGELITLAEAERRAEIYSETDNGSSYLFDLDKFSKIRKDEGDEDLGGSQMFETVNQDEIYVVDGKNYGGVTRFINHSCDPNLLIYAVTRERADYRLYDLAMFAQVDIPAYEELTFSYVGGDQGEPDPGVLKYNCYCGSAHCRGYLW